MRPLLSPPLARFLLAAVLLQGAAHGGDWPQFQRAPERTGDAAEESLATPLGLALCVRLEDAVTTAPAVVGGRVYVVDQMGTAYAIDVAGNRIVWRAAPDGERACGGNSSSPAVVGGRVYYGTTAGRFHVLDAADGRLVRSLDAGWPITGSPAAAGERIYVQHLGGAVLALDRDGRLLWTWKHYEQYVDPKTNKLASGFPGSFHDLHYAGGEIAVAGRKLLVNMGWDLYCLEDAGEAPRLAWCNRAPLGKDPGIPMGPAVAGDWVYCGHPGTDQFGGFMRVRLADGVFDTRRDFKHSGYPGSIWAVFATPAVRGETALFPTHYMGVQAYDFAAQQTLWYARTDNSLDQRRFTGSIGSPALSRDHAVFGTVHGDLHIVRLDSTGGWPEFKPAPFTFRTPFRRPIGSSPAISGGAVYFGCDDGYLYGLAPGGERPLPERMADLAAIRTRAEPATGKAYGAPVASVDQGNTGRVDDPRLRPPFRVRWAMRPGDLRVQLSADLDSAYFISEAGTLAAIEQATGRIRWRKRLPGPVDGWKQLLLDSGRLYVTRNSSLPGRAPDQGGSTFAAYSAATGEKLWEQPWGTIQGTCRTAAVVVGDVVAGFTAEGQPPRPVARAFRAASGEPLWRVELAGQGKTLAGGACVLDGRMFFSCGQTWGNGSGSTLAIEPASGKTLWTNAEHHVHGYGRPAARDGKLYLGGQSGAPFYCLSAADGSLVWKAEGISYSHSPALGEDYFVVRGYGGHGVLRDLATGKTITRNGREALGGCPDHSCAPVLLTSGRLSLAVSTSGLYVRDVDTGEVVWQSLGFAPRACTSPTPASGRLFYSPNVNNMLYCFEPDVKPAPRPPERTD